MVLLADLTQDEMIAWVTDLPRDLRTELAHEASLVPLVVQQRHRDEEAETEKALFRLADGALVEGVLMDYPAERGGRHTVCLSTQVGCALGCGFCATGLQGWTRDLSPGEIAGQVLHFERVLRARGARVTNVVYMGMGEPLLPYESTITSVRLLTDPRYQRAEKGVALLAFAGAVYAGYTVLAIGSGRARRTQLNWVVTGTGALVNVALALGLYGDFTRPLE